MNMSTQKPMLKQPQALALKQPLKQPQALASKCLGKLVSWITIAGACIASYAGAAPIELSKRTELQIPVEYAYPFTPGLAVVVLNVGNDSQIHLLDGNSQTASFRDHVQGLPGKQAITQDYSASLNNRVLVALRDAPFGAPVDRHSMMDISGNGEVSFRNDVIAATGSFVLSEDNRYYAVERTQIRGLGIGTQTYDPCALLAGGSDPNCSTDNFAALSASSGGFWLLRKRSLGAGDFAFELARFSFSGTIQEVQTLFNWTPSGSFVRNIRFNRDIAGAIHVAFASGNQVAAATLTDAGTFALTHSGVFNCTLCSNVQAAGATDWISISGNVPNLTIRKHRLASSAAGQNPTGATTIFEKQLAAGLIAEINTSLGGQSVIRFAAPGNGNADFFRWLSSNGVDQPVAPWHTAGFGQTEDLFVTKSVQIDGQNRTVGTWLRPNGSILLDDEYINDALVNPTLARTMFRGTGELFTAQEYPLGTSSTVDVWRIVVTGIVQDVAQFVRGGNGRFITSKFPSDYLHYLSTDQSGQYRLQTANLANGSVTSVNIPNLCNLQSVLAVNQIVYLHNRCGSQNDEVLGINGQTVQSLFDFPPQTINLTSVIGTGLANDIARFAYFDQTQNRFIVFGLSGLTATPRFVALGLGGTIPPIITGNGDALGVQSGLLLLTRYRAFASPINNYRVCGTNLIDDGLGDVWTSASNTSPTQICRNDLLGFRNQALGLPAFNSATRPALDGDLLLPQANVLVRYSPTPTGSVVTSSLATGAAEDFGGPLNSAVSNTEYASISIRNASSTVNVLRPSWVVNRQTIPTRGNINEPLLADGFED